MMANINAERETPLQPDRPSAPAQPDAYHAHRRSADRASVQVMESIIELIAILLVAFSPIAFGATERWARLVVHAAVCAMCAAWCFRAILRRKLAYVRSPLNPLIAMFFILACVQLVPLPGFLAGKLAPATVHAATGTLPGAAADTAGTQSTETGGYQPQALRCISSNRAAGRALLYQASCYAIAFLVIINTYRRRGQVSRLLTAVVAAGFTVAMLGVLGRLAPNGKILWFRDPPAGAIPFGPFVNRNHFAGYLVMVVPIALGMMLATRNREKKALLGFASAFMAAAVFASASRGGAFSLAAAAATFGLMMVSSKAARKNLLPLALVGCVAAAGALVIGIGPLLARAGSLVGPEAAREFRWPLWKDTVRMFGAFPIFGVGLGCFRSIFPAYKTFPAQLLFTHVENDYLHLMVEMGLAGFTVGMVFIGLILKNAFRSLRRKRSSYSRGLLIGLTAAAVGMLAHSLVDFNLHVPSNGLLFAMLLALLVVLGSVHVSVSSPWHRMSWISIPARRLLKGEAVVAPGVTGAFCLSSAMLCLLAFCVASNACSVVAERDLDRVEQAALAFVKGEGSLDVAHEMRTVQSAISKDRDNAQWHFKAGLFYQTLGQIKTRLADPTTTQAGADYLYKLAISEFTKASALDYFNSHYRTSLGVAQAEAGHWDDAERTFRIAMNLNPTSAWTHRKCGTALWDVNRPAAQAAFRRALDLDPHYTLEVLTALNARSDDPADLRACIPDNNATIFEYARFLFNNGMAAEAENVLVSLLPRVEEGPDRHLAAKILFNLGLIRQSTGSEQEAVACFLKAVSLQPDKPAYYEELGYACLRQERYDEARRYLEQRLRMSPDRDGRVFLALAEVYEQTGPKSTAHHYYRRALDAFPPSWSDSRRQAQRGIERTAD